MKRKIMTMMEKLKGLTLDRMSVEEEVELLAAARANAIVYSSLEIPAPKWLTDGMRELEVDLKRKREDMLKAELARLKQRKAQLRTKEEERIDIEAQIAALEGTLGNASA